MAYHSFNHMLPHMDDVVTRLYEIWESYHTERVSNSSVLHNVAFSYVYVVLLTDIYDIKLLWSHMYGLLT